jgi:hypothetical protein
MSMVALMGIVPAVMGVVAAVLLVRSRPRSVPNLPRRLTTLATVGLGVALAMSFVMLASGSWPFQSVGDSSLLESLSRIIGGWQFAVPLLGGVIATVLQCVPASAGQRKGVAELAPRTPFSFATVPWLLGTGVLLGVAFVAALLGGLASRPDEDGAYTMWVQDVGLGTVGRLIYGWSFSAASLVLLLLLTVATIVGLTLIARPSIAEPAAEDLANRRSRTRTLLATTSGSALIHLGTVLIFFACTANLSTGIPVGDALVPVYPPFAVLAPLFLGSGIGAIIVGFVLWFLLLIEQLTAASAKRESTATHAY